MSTGITGMRGSVSPVLTATGFVNGKWQFSTPYRIDTAQPITARRRYACAVLGVVIVIILSVRLSHACFVTNPKNLQRHFYTA